MNKQAIGTIPSNDLVTKDEALQAVKTLLLWAGENPDRSGLLETPERVVKSYIEFFAGYKQDPAEILNKTFDEIEGYSDMILLKDIAFSSHCEHHMAPIIGKAHIAYLPNKRVVGISKLARIVECYAKRLQIQERLTSQIANSINDNLQARGVAVFIEADHQCISTRGAKKQESVMTTTCMLGEFQINNDLRREFMESIK